MDRLGDYAKTRAKMLAELGYIAFAADIYGKGIRPATPQEAATQAGIYKNNPKLMRNRVRAGLDALRREPLCDPKRVAAIGYCFGGTCVLELARSGADVAGVVSFHGGLSTANPADAKNIRGKVLVLHGGDDPHVSPKEVDAFETRCAAAGVDWQVVVYGGAVHAFTNPGAGGDSPRRGLQRRRRPAIVGGHEGVFRGDYQGRVRASDLECGGLPPLFAPVEDRDRFAFHASGFRETSYCRLRLREGFTSSDSKRLGNSAIL